jgi:hypothetical protein
MLITLINVILSIAITGLIWWKNDWLDQLKQDKTEQMLFTTTISFNMIILSLLYLAFEKFILN